MTAPGKNIPRVYAVGAASESDSNVCMIEAYRDAKDGGELILFQPSFISHISALGKDAARLTLHDDIVISVKMPPHALWKKIYERDFRSMGEPVSLLSVTGREAFPVQAEGVHVGQCTILSKTFNVYAALNDLPETVTYPDALKHISGMKDGAPYADEAALQRAVQEGSYTGGWFIPTFEMLEKNILASKHIPALWAAFSERAVSGDSYPDWYWSLTPAEPGTKNKTFNLREGKEGKADNTGSPRDSCRLVRLVPV